MGRYNLYTHIEANTAEELVITLRRIAHHIDADHDLTEPGRVVDTTMAGTPITPSWSVTVDHEPTETVRGAGVRQ